MRILIRPLILVMLLLIPDRAAAQSLRAMRRADSLLAQGQYKAAIAAYQSMLSASSGSLIVRHNLACAFARNRQTDSAFRHLAILAKGKMAADILTDADLLELRRDKRWTAIETQVVTTMETEEQRKIADLAYARKLWELHALDQALYADILIARQREGAESPAAKKLWTKKDSINRRNQHELQEMIRTKGWPKYSQVGRAAGDAAFLVIQHADSTLQRRFLPELLTYCKAKEASWESYALMYDRLQMARNLPQRYGTQVWSNPKTGERKLWKLEDPLSVEAWRKEAGMMPLSEYAQMFGLQFPPVGGQH